MGLKLSVGFQKKVGLPDYGSVGASCHVEFEIDSALLQNNLDGFHQKAKNAFIACQQAVNDQLSRQPPSNGNGHSPPPTNGNAPTNGNGANGNGHGRSTTRLATQSQARAIRAIANRQRLDVVKLLESRYGINSLEKLSLSDASALIDELKKSNGDQGGRS